MDNNEQVGVTPDLSSNGLRGQFNVWGTAEKDLPSSLQLVIKSDLRSSISIAPKNKMRGTIFQVVGTGDSELQGSIHPYLHSDLYSTISIAPKNKMRGTIFQVLGVGDAELSSSIYVTGQSSLTSSIFIRPDNLMEGKAAVVAQRKSELPASIQLGIKSDLPGQISIRPHNKMEGIAEIVQPPSFITKLGIVKDTFIRDRLPKLNFGHYQDMFVGNINGEVFRSLLQFQTGNIPEGMYIKRAELVLHALNLSSDTDIQVMDVEDEWLEHSTTWDNQPSTSDELLSFNSGKKLGQIKIDVRDLVTSCIQVKESI